MRFSRGGGIGLEPVYAADATVSLTGGTITAGSFTGTVGSTAISDGTITSGTFSGTVTLKGDDIKKAIKDVDISLAKVGSDTDSLTIGGLATNTQKITYVAGTGTTVDGVVLNNKGISAADGNFTVDGTNAETVVSGANGKTTIYGGGVSIHNADSSKAVYINEGSVLADDAVKAKVISAGLDIRMENGNVVAKNGLYIGYTSDKIIEATYENSKFAVKGNDGSFKAAGGKFGVDNDGALKAAGDNFGVDKDGDVKTTGALKGQTLGIGGTDNNKFTVAENGNTTVGGDLTVNGAASFTKETTFANGIKTDTISEKTDGEGVTVDGVVLKDGGITAAGDVTTTGALKGKTLGIGTNGNEFTVDKDGNTAVGGTLGVTGATTLEKTLDVKGATTLGSTLAVNGNTTVGGTLGVNGKTTLSDELQVDKKATFGSAASANTVIEGDVVETGRIDTDRTKASNIGGVRLHNGQIIAEGMTINGTIDLENLKVNDTLTVGINTKITDGTLQFDTADDKKLTADKLANINQTIKANKVIEANSATIGNVAINGGDVTTATGTIKGNTITDGNGFTATDGRIIAKEGQIGNVVISAAGEVSGVSEIKASTFKVNEGNYLDGNGITAIGGHIGGAVIDATTLTVGYTKLDSAEGITTNKLKIDGMTLTGTSLDTGTAKFEVNGVEFKQGQVNAMADKGFVAGTSSFKERSLIVDDNNKLEATSGLTTEKATVNGTLDVTGKATFGTDANNQTTIYGKTVTTGTLKADNLILGASGDPTVEVNKDGSLIAAGGKFEVDKDGALKAADGAFTVAKDGKTIFKKDADNLSSINGGNIWAKATDAANSTSSELLHNYKGLHISGTQAGQTSAFDFNAATGISTFTGQDRTTTTINGSVITSTKATDDTGVLNGSNLTLVNGANKTELTAGGATFIGKKGDSSLQGNKTTIDGGVITTDTLNVERINLGGELYDKNGTAFGGNLSMDKDGNFSAAGGNFTVKGGTATDPDRGTMHNKVGNTYFDTTKDGASMKFDNTATTGGIKSEVAVADDSAKISAGASSIEVKNDGITNNGVTTFNGTTGTTTKIDGGTITTNHLITDKLTITGSGNADGTGSTTGSIAFGGNGSITSNIKDAATGKEATFKTDEKGTFTEAKDNDGNKTTNTVNAKGNTNVVTDSTNASTATQTATSIGGVVTNGTVTMRQELTADGVKVSVDGDTANYTQITNKDVSITDQKNPGKRINLSDLGQLNDLDGELAARDEYQDNKTAVGAINAEAGIRREEVARLDGRINDVNDRVNKVGAMAAAIASLKSIGYDPQAPSEFSIGLGQYKGETGVAMGFFHYPNKNFMINVSLSTAGGETMGGIGATWRFGHKSPQKLLEEQREAQAKKELAAAEKYQAAAKLAKEAQERAEYAAKLARQAQVSADNAKAAADATQAKHFG